MVSEVPAPLVNKVNTAADKQPSIRSSSNKKNHGKVPKKIHKSEREKRKRNHLNELFLELGTCLESDRQNNGKASILVDASRLLRDLLTQVECLNKENAAFLSEFNYVTLEKNELKDETSILETEIEKLQAELQEKIHDQSETSYPEDPTLQGPPIVGPVFVVPLHHDLQIPLEAEIATTCKPPSYVRKPHPRYPTPADSWPSQLLGKQPRTTQENII